MKKIKSMYLIIILFIALFSISIYLIYEYKSIPTIVSEFENFLYKYEDFNEEIPVHFSDDCSKYEKEIIYLTKEESLQDIENLFSLLKFGYSGYSYFGGDQTFSEAKDNILDQISVMESKNISRNLLSKIIQFNLSFIQDSHFAVDNHKLCDYTMYFSTRKYTFYKDTKGFYTYINDKLYYLSKVNNDDV